MILVLFLYSIGPEASLYCPFCQATPQRGRFCTQCGRLLPTPTAGPIPQGRRWLGLFIALIFAVGIVGFVTLTVALRKDTSQHASVEIAGKKSRDSIPPLKAKTQAEQKKEAAAQAMLNETLRVAYANDVEDRMLAKGINCDVVAIGPKHTILKFKWALVSKVTAYQFAHSDTDMWASMEKLGFTKFIITNGYDEEWFWALRPNQ